MPHTIDCDSAHGDQPPEKWSREHVCDDECEAYLERAWEVFAAQVKPGDFEVVETTIFKLKA